MVESIASRPVSSETKVPRVAPTTPLAAVVASPSDTGPAETGDTTALSGVATTLAAAPPIDMEHVARVKRAIERGDFPILPATIADRMIALKYNWMSANDQA